MPVAANFSKAFYDKLGHRVVDELVGWLNSVDTTYRADLRELNELNFARFDAKLEQRMAELRAEFEMRFTALDAKLDQRIAELRAEFQAGRAELRGEFRSTLATELGRLRADLIKWSFVFFATAALAVIGLR